MKFQKITPYLWFDSQAKEAAAMKNFEERLKGGHPNSLGNTVEIVAEVLAETEHFNELFSCYFSNDETVRLRTSNAMKRICKEDKSILIPYIDQLLSDIAQIDQASTQWTLAQLFGMLEKDMSEKQRKQAVEIMKHNLANHQDWIVLAQTMGTLTTWAKKDGDLKDWLQPHLESLLTDKRKSVSGKAKKMIEQLNK
jgi:hypothetical protein